MPRSKKSTILNNPLEQIFSTTQVSTSNLEESPKKEKKLKKTLTALAASSKSAQVINQSKNQTPTEKISVDDRSQKSTEHPNLQENKYNQEEKKRDFAAHNTIKKWSRLASACAIPPLPLLATAAASGIQIKMIQELCNIYKVPFHKELAKASISSIIGSGATLFSLNYLAKELLRGIPYVGSALLVISQPPAIYTLTKSLGTIFMSHFQNQGDLTNLDLAKSRAMLKNKIE
jgi:uncharacterized protein (DUF697 family)